MRTRLIAGLLLIAPALAGCTVPPWSDPFERPGTWRPTGANEANLRAMAQNPADLERGQAARGDLAAEGIPPIERLLAGQRRPLPAVASNAGPGGGGGQ